MTPQQALQSRYSPDLKPKSLYPTFHAAASDLASATGRGYSECLGEVFDMLAMIAGCKVNSDSLGKTLKRLHEDGTLGSKIAAAQTADQTINLRT